MSIRLNGINTCPPEDKYELAKQLHGENRISEAIALYHESADDGYVPAQVNLGFMYYNGLTVKQDLANAKEYWLKAVEYGDDEAMFYLGKMYDNAEDRDIPIIKRYYRMSADEGNVVAMYSLGTIYDELKDYKEAAKWYMRSAEKGNADAQNNLGNLYEYGMGVEIDLELARKLYYNATSQGNAAAYFNLGLMYYHGKGVTRDYRYTERLWRQAAADGFAKAQYNLGVIYQSGLNGDSENNKIPRDYSQAEYWYRQACGKYEKAREKLAALLAIIREQKLGTKVA